MMRSTTSAARSALGAVLFVCALLSACKDSESKDGTDAGGVRVDASVDVVDANVVDSAQAAIDASGPEACDDTAAGQLPEELSCTGLYSDFAKKKVASGVRFFAPAVQLWSDGAEKARYISLPKGKKIDASDPTDWKFPVGTKLWKEFKWKGKRAETRLFEKVEGRWIKTSYQWNADETRATRFAGGLVDVAGESYYIPSAKECDQCHKGRDDRALGFEAILLGLEGAEGLTLDMLSKEGLIENHEGPTSYQIGDDGTGKAAAAIGWLHVNCGVSCHNGNSASEAYKTDLRLRLLVDEVDGSSIANVDAIETSIGLDARTPLWSSWKLITAGSADESLLYYLIHTRDPAKPKDQMPPIASRVVDEKGTALVKAWIEALDDVGEDDAGAL